MSARRSPIRTGGTLLLLAGFLTAAGSVRAASVPPAAGGKKVVVLGIDGLDPRLLRQFMADGSLPHFSRLVAAGDFVELQTSAAPQSPVAWSEFITGMDAGGHGIFDFVHRDPGTMLLQFSMSRAVPPERTLGLGSWVLPLSSGRVELLRKGKAFWQLLGERSVPSTVFRMPVNFPPVAAPLSRQLSGMGTPDILGTPGTFSAYLERVPANAAEITGGKVFGVVVADGVVRAELPGPPNPFRRKQVVRSDGGRAWEESPLTAPFTILLDRERRVARFEVGDNQFLLREGEWSDWVEVRYQAVPWLVTVRAIGRFFLKQVAPELKLYVTPLQLDPAEPAMPISQPADWSRRLCACQGFFSTLGLPHDTKALTYGVLEGKDFWEQLLALHEEGAGMFKALLAERPSGLFFFYFGSVDQGSHMLWHYMDERHPQHVADKLLSDGIRTLYRQMDAIVGQAVAAIDERTTLIVMSDHGFAPFSRGVNLNSWLLGKGYLQFDPGVRQQEVEYFQGVDWNRTRAYAVGLNGLYLNVRGREKHGIIEPGAAYERLLDQLEGDLLALRDPRGGDPVVTRVTRPRRDFHGPERERGPDLIVGYGWGYRSSWDSPLGRFPGEEFVDNQEAWTGDHCIDNRLVPGVLIANRAITLASPTLRDLTVAVLDEFDVEHPPEMIGRDCLGAEPPHRGQPAATRGER